jgi:hypothetical protein
VLWNWHLWSFISDVLYGKLKRYKSRLSVTSWSHRRDSITKASFMKSGIKLVCLVAHLPMLLDSSTWKSTVKGEHPSVTEALWGIVWCRYRIGCWMLRNATASQVIGGPRSRLSAARTGRNSGSNVNSQQLLFLYFRPLFSCSHSHFLRSFNDVKVSVLFELGAWPHRSASLPTWCWHTAVPRATSEAGF